MSVEPVPAEQGVLEEKQPGKIGREFFQIFFEHAFSTTVIRIILIQKLFPEPGKHRSAHNPAAVIDLLDPSVHFERMIGIMAKYRYLDLLFPIGLFLFFLSCDLVSVKIRT